MTNSDTPPPDTSISARAPRYASYPTAPHFTDAISGDTRARWLRDQPAGPVSLYVHVPFCSALCWFCTCRTQGTLRAAPVRRYLAHLHEEIARVAALTPDHAHVSRMHWGGGSPSVLSPVQIRDLFARLKGAFTFAPTAEISVEIDARDMTRTRLDALAEGGLTRASVAVLDFDEMVQHAINRLQSWEMTRDVIAALRARGNASIDVDVIYGLPHQTAESLGRTLQRLVALTPDRIALYGYVHMPWMARRQRAIDTAALPGGDARMAQADVARDMLIDAGYRPVGIDHFARPGDGLARAAARQGGGSGGGGHGGGGLRRNFMGYVDDQAETLIGLGASAISRLPGGYVKNIAATDAYQSAIAKGGLPAARGKTLSLDDRARAHAIERLMCDFTFDPADMTARFGDAAAPCLEQAATLLSGTRARWLIALPGGGFVIAKGARRWTRVIAACFDAYFDADDARHSRVV
jgi:oxygen-independent coproporphyrinogen-3 oxidase